MLTIRAYADGEVLADVCCPAGYERVLASRDHGATFADITPPGPHGKIYLRVEDLFALGPHLIWLVGWRTDPFSSFVYRTSDGGHTWTRTPVAGPNESAGSTDSISFEDATHGWLVRQLANGGISELYSTVDGGDRWRRVNRQLPALAPVVPGSATDLWQGGGFLYGQTFAHSADGGRTWTPIDLGRADDRSRTYSGPGVFAGRTVEAVSTVADAGETLDFYRAETGHGWQQIAHLGPLPDRPSPSDDRRRADVVFAGPTAWWVIAAVPRPTVYVTADAGRHWATRTLPVRRLARGGFLQVVAADSRHAYVVIGEGRTWRALATSDGGRTWRPFDPHA